MSTAHKADQGRSGKYPHSLAFLDTWLRIAEGSYASTSYAVAIVELGTRRWGLANLSEETLAWGCNELLRRAKLPGGVAPKSRQARDAVAARARWSPAFITSSAQEIPNGADWPSVEASLPHLLDILDPRLPVVVVRKGTLRFIRGAEVATRGRSVTGPASSDPSTSIVIDGLSGLNLSSGLEGVVEPVLTLAYTQAPADAYAVGIALGEVGATVSVLSTASLRVAFERLHQRLDRASPETVDGVRWFPDWGKRVGSVDGLAALRHREAVRFVEGVARHLCLMSHPLPLLVTWGMSTRDFDWMNALLNAGRPSQSRPPPGWWRT